MAHFKLGEILLKQGLITEAQLKQAIEAQRQEKGRIGEVLVKLGFLREEDITSALGTQLGIPYSSANSDLLKPREEQDLDKLVPQDFAQKNCVLPLSRNMSVLTCAVADPLDLMMLDNLKRLTSCQLNLVISTGSSILQAVNQYYTRKKKGGDLKGTLLNEAVQSSYQPDTKADSQSSIPTEASRAATAELSIDKLIAKAGEA